VISDAAVHQRQSDVTLEGINKGLERLRTVLGLTPGAAIEQQVRPIRPYPNDNRETHALAHQRVVEYKRHQALALSELSARAKEQTFETFRTDSKNADALRLAREVVANPSLGVGIYGPPGVGKSHLTRAIANELLARGVPVAAISAVALLSRVRATFGENGETERALTERYARVEVLVLDDLDKVKWTPWAAQALWQIIDMRYEANLPIIITANASLTDIALRIPGDVDANTIVATLDRIREMTMRWVRVDGSSHRRPQALATALQEAG
jgi:DNA replication protein DnaC